MKLISKKIYIISCLLLFVQSCSKEDSNNLTPARDIIGTWKTSFTVPHKIKTDFYSFNLEDVATQDRLVTLIITSGADDNNVNVEYRYTGSNFKNINANCTSGTGYTPDVSPTFYKGVISGTRLSVQNSKKKEIGTFTFTTSLMQGTWKDEWCLGFCQTVYTDTNQLKLMKQ